MTTKPHNSSRNQAIHVLLLGLVVKYGRWIRYLGLGMTINALIWSLALLSLKTAKAIYTTEWALIIPGSGTGVNFNVPDIGQASSSSVSAFSSSSSDPRANYNYLLTSDPVLSSAAASVKMSVTKFGKPHIKLIDNTTVMQLQVSGSSPQEAQQKSLALYHALSSRLDQLRTEAAAHRKEGSKEILSSSRYKLEAEERRLSQYKAHSVLTSVDQIKDLLANIEQLRRQRAETLAQEQSAASRVKQLSTNLGLSPQQAADAFAVQSDPIFQQYLKDYSEANGNLSVFLSKWGPNHPEVIKEQVRWQAARSALLARSSSILNKAIDMQTLEHLNLTSIAGAGRVNLFQQLVAVEAEQKGVLALAQALDQQITFLGKRLQKLAQKQATLDSLERNVKIAEAVFSSTLAKVELGKADIFVDYPLVQIFVEPSLPEQPTSPKPMFVLGGAFLGSLFSTTGLIILWWRKNMKTRISKIISREPV